MTPKLFRGIIYSILLCNILLASSHATALTGHLIVKFQGFDNNEGELGASIVNHPRHFLRDYRKSIRFTRSHIQDRQVTWVIDELPYGNYAISSYHDENNNNKYDLNFLGIPVEDYGFSNNARGNFAAPKYEDALFKFSRSGQVVIIEVEDFSFSDKNSIR